MTIKGNKKWKIKLIKLHKKIPMLDTFIMFIFGLIAYPINEFLILCLREEKEYSNQDIWFCLLCIAFDIFMFVYMFKFSKEALNISIGNKKFTMKDFDDEFVKCMTEELSEKDTDEKIKMYHQMHSLQIGTDTKLINAKRNRNKQWTKISSQDKIDKGEN